MARPQGRSSFPSMDSMARDFTITSAPSRPSQALQDSSLRPNTLPFGTSFISPRPPSRIASDLKSRQQLSDQLLTDNFGSLPDNASQHLRHQTSGSVSDDPLQLLNLADVRHPKVPSNKPWNPIDASMSLHPDHNPLKIEHTNGHLLTDSGYTTGSVKSRHPLQPNQLALSPIGSLEIGSAGPYDEPIGSAAQQTQYLPDQQHRFSTLNLINPTSPRPSSTAGGESVATPSGSPPFRCEECAEMFNTKSEKTKHMARHTKKFTCDYERCPRGADGFATKNDLDRHKSSVHHDNTVTRKEYQCCVTGCKDPNKIWDRKDNFKAHVKRMHPEHDVDEVVTNSFIGDRAPSASGAVSHHESMPDPSPPLAGQQPYHPESQLEYMGGATHPSFSPFETQLVIPYSQAPPSIADLSRPARSIADASQDINQDDTYYLPGPSGPHHTHLSQFSSYSIPDYNQSGPLLRSVTTQPTNPSMTMALPTSIPDPSHTINRHPDPHLNNSQAVSAQTMPGPDPRTDESRSQPYRWSSRGDSSSTVDPSVPPMDPLMQTGSWDEQTANHAAMLDTPEQSAQTGLGFNTDEQLATTQLTDQRLNDVMQRIDAILDPLSPEEKKIVLKTARNRSGFSNEKQRVMQRAMEAFSPAPKPDERKYVCSRKGCGKTFKQNNIKTKHERRHDRLFFCTFDDCYSTFGTKDDLRRHEQRKHIKDAFNGYRCFKADVQSSHHKLDCFKFFHSKDEFEQHRRDVHRERAEKNNGGLKACKSCFIRQGSPGHFWCGFCNSVIQNKVDAADASRTEKSRLAHIDHHITKEYKTMEHWIDLKSNGKTKSQVKRGAIHQNANEDSQDDEESESFSPEAPDPMRNQNAPRLSDLHPHTAAPVPTMMKRKRSYRDEDADVSAPAIKVPRITVQTSDSQDENTIPNVSEGASTGTILFDTAANRPPAQAQVVGCCTCHTARAIDGREYCCPTCYHPWCLRCSCYDVLGQLLPAHTNSSARQQANG